MSSWAYCTPHSIHQVLNTKHSTLNTESVQHILVFCVYTSAVQPTIHAPIHPDCIAYNTCINHTLHYKFLSNGTFKITAYGFYQSQKVPSSHIAPLPLVHELYVRVLHKIRYIALSTMMNQSFIERSVNLLIIPRCLILIVNH